MEGRGHLAPTANPPLPDAAHIDPAGQLAFLRQHYLGAQAGFVREDGAKLKLVLGGTGAGKTHFLAALAAAGRAEGFATAHVDARTQPLWGFDCLYQALVADLDLAGLARAFVVRALEGVGYRGIALEPGHTLENWAGAHGYEPGPLRVRFEEELDRRLLRNVDIDYGYAVGLAKWCTVLALEPAGGGGEAGGLLEHWLRGGRVAVRDCNRLRLRHSADRYTARLWLRSLLHFMRMAGVPGLVGVVDRMETVLTVPQRAPRAAGRAAGGPGLAPGGGATTDAAAPGTVVAVDMAAQSAETPWDMAAGDATAERAGPLSGQGAAHTTLGGFAGGIAAAGDVRYTPQRRADLYECLRALIDDMGLMPGLLLAIAGPSDLVTNERVGFQSYPALAERVRSEVQTVELNRFADAIVLERLWATDVDAGRALAERLVAAVAPGAGDAVRQRAVAAAAAQWAARDVTVSAVRRSVLAVLRLAQADGSSEVRGEDRDPAAAEGSTAATRSRLATLDEGEDPRGEPLTRPEHGGEEEGRSHGWI